MGAGEKTHNIPTH